VYAWYEAQRERCPRCEQFYVDTDPILGGKPDRYEAVDRRCFTCEKMDVLKKSWEEDNAASPFGIMIGLQRVPVRRKEEKMR
jgi:hypothetical protein